MSGQSHLPLYIVVDTRCKCGFLERVGHLQLTIVVGLVVHGRGSSGSRERRRIEAKKSDMSATQ